MFMTENRNTLNVIDYEIRQLLYKRFEIIYQIGLYKKKNQMVVQDLNREAQIKNVIENENSVFKTNIIIIYEEILRQSRDIQNKIDTKYTGL